MNGPETDRVAIGQGFQPGLGLFDIGPKTVDLGAKAWPRIGVC